MGTETVPTRGGAVVGVAGVARVAAATRAAMAPWAGAAGLEGPVEAAAQAGLEGPVEPPAVVAASQATVAAKRRPTLAATCPSLKSAPAIWTPIAAKRAGTSAASRSPTARASPGVILLVVAETLAWGARQAPVAPATILEIVATCTRLRVVRTRMSRRVCVPSIPFVASPSGTTTA